MKLDWFHNVENSHVLDQTQSLVHKALCLNDNQSRVQCCLPFIIMIIIMIEDFPKQNTEGKINSGSKVKIKNSKEMLLFSANIKFIWMF